MKLDYIANQLTPEGLDEVQRILLNYTLHHHTALAGAPGIGKTHIAELLAEITQKPMYGSPCSEFVTDSALIGFPDLKGRNGATESTWSNGWVTKAMVENGIYYGDEFDQLEGSTQKSVNGAFDARAKGRGKLTRRDGTVIVGEPDFFGLLTYNPSERISTHQLEESMADRFVHMPFEYLPEELEARIALGDVNGATIEQRALFYDGKTIKFLKKEGTSMHDFFTGQPFAGDSEKVFEYGTFIQPHAAGRKSLAEAFERNKLGYKIAQFFTAVRSFADFGTNKFDDIDKEKKLKTYLKSIGEINQVRLHRPSTRIIKAAVAQYDALRAMGMDADKAHPHAAGLVVDQVTYGKFGNQPLGDTTVRNAVEKIAEFYGLLPKPVTTSVATP